MSSGTTKTNISGVHVAVERLYEVFGDFRPGSRIDYYPPHEIGAEVEHRLLTQPLRALSAQDLGRYMQAVTLFGRPNCPWWPYYVPRILELIANYEWPHPSGAHACLDILHGDYDWSGDGAACPPLWRTGFSAVQVAAIDDFAAMFWKRLITSPYHCITEPDHDVCDRFTGGAGIGILFDLFAGAGVPVARLLDVFDETRSPLADVHVAAFVSYVLDEDHCVEDIAKFCRGYSWGSNVPALHAWLMRPSLRRRLTTAFFREDRARERKLLNRAETVLRLSTSAHNQPPWLGSAAISRSFAKMSLVSIRSGSA
jgi:hypothetical protein